MILSCDIFEQPSLTMNTVGTGFSSNRLEAIIIFQYAHEKDSAMARASPNGTIRVTDLYPGTVPCPMVRHQLSGGRGKVEDPVTFLETVRAHHDGDMLAVDASKVCGPEHMTSALAHAERAFRYGRNAADTLALETMLYLSGERQLSKAKDKMGLRAGSERVALLFLEQVPDERLWDHLGLRRDDSVLDFEVAKAMSFGIGMEELASVPGHMAQDLVLERVAFVELIKR
jgi:KEOPS complex subunit Cgi121